MRGQCIRQRAGHHTRAGGGLEYARRIENCHPVHEIGGVGFEDQRNEVTLIELGDRTAKSLSVPNLSMRLLLLSHLRQS
jgi:hypothetical protein